MKTASSIQREDYHCHFTHLRKIADERAATIRANKSLHENASFAIGNEASKVLTFRCDMSSIWVNEMSETLRERALLDQFLHRLTLYHLNSEIIDKFFQPYISFSTSILHWGGCQYTS